MIIVLLDLTAERCVQVALIKHTKTVEKVLYFEIQITRWCMYMSTNTLYFMFPDIILLLILFSYMF